MIRIPRPLFLALLVVVFIGAVIFSFRPVWNRVEQSWIRPVRDAESGGFPVLVRNKDSGYKAEPIGKISEGSFIVSYDFNEEAINKELNSSIGSTRGHRFFQILENTRELTRLSLEVPTKHYSSKLQGWYDIENRVLVPKKILTYGPSFSLVVLTITATCGIAAAIIFAMIFRPRKRTTADRP